MSTDWGRITRVLPHARRVLLYGPPGTGKTTVAAGEDGKPVFFVSLHDESTVAELVGHFVPVGDRFIWLDGPAMAAWRIGGRLVLDEIDFASGAVLSIARGLLNDERVARLSIPNQALAGMTDEEMATAILSGQGLETVRPADGFQVVATMNGVPEDLDEPLRDRFDAQFFVDEPHPNAIAALPKRLRDIAERTAVEANPDRRISVRRWLSFAGLARKLNVEDASHAVFGSRAGDVFDGLALGGTGLETLLATDEEIVAEEKVAAALAAKKRAAEQAATVAAEKKRREDRAKREADLLAARAARKESAARAGEAARTAEARRTPTTAADWGAPPPARPKRKSVDRDPIDFGLYFAGDSAAIKAAQSLYENKTIDELRTISRERDLKVNGYKDVLVARIVDDGWRS